MLRIIISFLFFLLTISSHGQCIPQKDIFKPGEKVTYNAYYNWGFIWVHAGVVEFSVNTKVYNSKPVYFFQAVGNSLKNYDWLYKVRDKFQSYVDIETFQPLWSEKNTLEGGHFAYEQYTFVPQKRKIYSVLQTSDQPYLRDTLPGKPCTYDVLSAIYYCRNIDFERYKINEKIPVNTIIENKEYALYLRYKGKENVTNKDGKVYRCIKFSALLVEGTIFKGGEDMFIWVTDDLNRVPILVEAKILIGSVKAYMFKAEGLRNEQTALVSGK